MIILNTACSNAIGTQSFSDIADFQIVMPEPEDDTRLVHYFQYSFIYSIPFSKKMHLSCHDSHLPASLNYKFQFYFSILCLFLSAEYK